MAPYTYNNPYSYSYSWNSTQDPWAAQPLRYSYDYNYGSEGIEPVAPEPVIKTAEAWLDSELDEVMAVGRLERVLA